MIDIKLGSKEYHVSEAKSDLEKKKGLLKRTSLADDEGMIFYWDKPQEVGIWMKDTLIPLDIIFINDDYEVIKVAQGEPDSTELIPCDNVSYVVELNVNSGVRIGDDLEIPGDDEGPSMKVIGSDGQTQMELWGGERIVSRKETKILVKKAKKAADTNSESDIKALGRYMFKVLHKQDNREPEYVLA